MRRRCRRTSERSLRTARDNPKRSPAWESASCALSRKFAPKVVIGLHASRWADPDPAKIAAFLSQVGGAESDIVVIDMLDRDAGCFEAHTDPACQRNDGPWYWDETNQKSPNFREHLAWAKTIGEAIGKPILWWQVPFGVPSATPGGDQRPLPRQPRAVRLRSSGRVRRGGWARRRVRNGRRQPDRLDHRRRAVQDRRRQVPDVPPPPLP